MQFNRQSPSLATTLSQRRQRLSQIVDFPVILWSGSYIPRNFTANHFPFRASSHFLYFAGISLANAAIRIENGKLELFLDEGPDDSIIWQGEMPKRSEIAEYIGADADYPIDELASRTKGAATISIPDVKTYWLQSQILQRPLALANALQGIDLELAKAIISLRLYHDDLALEELRQAIAVTVKAHKAGMEATGKGGRESNIRAAIEGVFIAHNMTAAYDSIVTVHGEVLHNEQYHHPLQPGDLLLVDAGAETENGWASDVTRTWPVTGKFSPTQRDIYEVVLAAHDTCIAQIKPGLEYRDIHLIGALKIAEGLVELGILKGDPQQLVEMDAHALFFVHGIGHILGLDVHDMEDLGDLAGYAEGRKRSDRFGLGFLRLNRPLKPRMIVTIEPGFYQNPAILKDSEKREKYRDVVNWERLATFADVRGIRIEDDVLITESGTEVLTSELPTSTEKIEELIGFSKSVS